jgi:5-methyltetrahydropteroyltriglutamate--homocysteine methyltransferase
MRETKKAVEAYWAGKISAEDLEKSSADVRKVRWQSQKEAGADSIASYVSPLARSPPRPLSILSETHTFVFLPCDLALPPLPWSGVCSGDFSLYDHVLDTCSALNIIPERYTKNNLSALDISFGTSLASGPLLHLLKRSSCPNLAFGL